MMVGYNWLHCIACRRSLDIDDQFARIRLYGYTTLPHGARGARCVGMGRARVVLTVTCSNGTLQQSPY